jgi:hypothetical protein
MTDHGDRVHDLIPCGPPPARPPLLTLFKHPPRPAPQQGDLDDVNYVPTSRWWTLGAPIGLPNARS